MPQLSEQTASQPRTLSQREPSGLSLGFAARGWMRASLGATGLLLSALACAQDPALQPPCDICKAARNDAGGAGPGVVPPDVRARLGRRDADSASEAALKWNNDPDPLADTDNEKLTRMALRFYGAQRCGKGDNWLLTTNPSGDSCHGDDGASAGGVDLTGGWHDAGDHLKVSLTIAYATYALLKGYDAFPTAFDDLYDQRYGPANGVPDLLDEAKYGADYLTKILIDSNSLVGRVGDLDADHGVWLTSPYQSTLGPEKDGQRRPILLAAAADVAGLSAAALALMSRLYSPFDAAAGAHYLQKARDLYSFAKRNPGTYSDGSYNSDSYQDDMLCGAAELYRTTGEEVYLEEAQKYDVPFYWVLSWVMTADLGRHTLAKAGAGTTEMSNWRQNMDERYLGSVTSDGFAWMGQKWGSARYAAGAAFGAALFYDVTGEARYRDFALGQLAYLTGSNPLQQSFIIGFGPNSPQHPHHRNAFGYDPQAGEDPDGWTAFNSGLPHKFLLAGGLVGGPMTSDPSSYVDQVDHHISNAVAIDYNAGLVGTAAFAVALER